MLWQCCGDHQSWSALVLHVLEKESNVKSKLLIIPIILLLSACGGGGGGDGDTNTPAADNPTTPNEQTVPQDGTPSEQLTALEESGSIPKLEREPTLTGTDADSNGIRDDIDQYIAEHYTGAQQVAAATQAAKAFQEILMVDTTDPAAVKSANKKLSEADHCIYQQFDGSNNTPQPAQVSQELEAITTNTKERLLAYLAFAKALDGTSWSIPEGDTCE